MHDFVAEQSTAVWHWGLASPGVTQRPVRHTVAAPQVQQSALVTHALRQAALTHTCAEAQSALARHCGCGRVSAWHMPSLHRSRGPQSEALLHDP
jgi:hypothetical protein